MSSLSGGDDSVNGIQTHGSDDGHDPSDQGEDLGDDCDPENNSDVESSRHRAKSRRLDREAASDVEGEEYEETDDGSVSPVRRRKRGRAGFVNSLIETEAVVDEEEEEEEEDGEYDSDRDADEELERVGWEMQDINRRNLMRDARSEEINAEEIARRMKERYGYSKKARKKFIEGLDQIPATMIMPSMYDLKLWICEVKEGKHREAVYTLMRRYLFEMKSDKDSGITSVFCRDSLKRYIYIEAKRRANVRKALENINYVFSTKLRLVPPQEMADCLKMKSKSVELIPGSWVRPKKGLYAGDIAKVTEVLVNGDVLCTLIPRINFEKLSTTGRFASSDQSSVKKAQDNTRPPQKLFNPAEYKYGYRRDNGYYIIGNNWINKRGFLEKAFKPSSINSTNVQPVLSEISNFSSASGDRIDLSNIGPNSTTSADDFQIGDVVIATAGSIKGTFGIVSSIQNGIVSFIPDESFKLNNTTVNLTFKELRRHLKVGDHVNIVGGEDAGETGIIVEVLDGTVTILSDSTLSEIKAFNRDVRLAVRTVTYQKMDAPYSSGDPVSFVGGAGVALKVDKSNVVVLNHFGQIQTLQMQKLRPKRGIHKATATDAFGRVITQDSSVEVVSKSAKDHSKIRATVIHIYKNSVFVKSREISENNGIIVVRSNKLYLLEQGIKDENRPLNRSYSHKRQYFNTQGYTQSAAYTSRNNRRMNGRRNRGDEYMSQTVVITSGPYKGYVGTVKDTCDETARVELHSKDHIVAISKSKLKLKEELETPLQRGHDGFVSTGSGTVMHHYRRRGGDIPYSDDIPCVDYGKDPAYHHPAQTPSYYNSRTPAWNPNISLPRNPD